MDTSLIQEPARRGRRRHSPEFRASVIQAAKQPGISIAAVALANGLNANMLRKWVAESDADHPVVPRVVDAKPTAAFVPLALSAPADTRSGASADIRVEVRRGTTSVSISWPAASAEACASWLRDLLR
jgi:transposase